MPTISTMHAISIIPKQPDKECGKVAALFHKYGIYTVWDLPFLTFGMKMAYYEKIRPIWNDSNKRIRLSIPRTYCDATHLIDVINFKIIEVFYEDEFLDGSTDYEGSGEKHSEFASWLINAYNYVKVQRPQLVEDLDNAYPPVRDIDSLIAKKTSAGGEKTYSYIPIEGNAVYYREVERIERTIEDADTKVLMGIIEYRGFFWD